MRSDIELALQVVHSDVGFTQGGMLAGLGLSPVRICRGHEGRAASSGRDGILGGEWLCGLDRTGTQNILAFESAPRSLTIPGQGLQVDGEHGTLAVGCSSC